MEITTVSSLQIDTLADVIQKQATAVNVFKTMTEVKYCPNGVDFLSMPLSQSTAQEMQVQYEALATIYVNSKKEHAFQIREHAIAGDQFIEHNNGIQSLMKKRYDELVPTPMHGKLWYIVTQDSVICSACGHYVLSVSSHENGLEKHAVECQQNYEMSLTGEYCFYCDDGKAAENHYEHYFSANHSSRANQGFHGQTKGDALNDQRLHRVEILPTFVRANHISMQYGIYVPIAMRNIIIQTTMVDRNNTSAFPVDMNKQAKMGNIVDGKWKTTCMQCATVKKYMPVSHQYAFLVWSHSTLVTIHKCGHENLVAVEEQLCSDVYVHGLVIERMQGKKPTRKSCYNRMYHYNDDEFDADEEKKKQNPQVIGQYARAFTSIPSTVSNEVQQFLDQELGVRNVMAQMVMYSNIYPMLWMDDFLGIKVEVILLQLPVPLMQKLVKDTTKKPTSCVQVKFHQQEDETVNETKLALDVTPIMMKRVKMQIPELWPRQISYDEFIHLETPERFQHFIKLANEIAQKQMQISGGNISTMVIKQRGKRGKMQPMLIKAM
jgi:hypothetical protein